MNVYLYLKLINYQIKGAKKSKIRDLGLNLSYSFKVLCFAVYRVVKGLRSDLFEGLQLSLGINIWCGVAVRTGIWL